MPKEVVVRIDALQLNDKEYHDLCISKKLAIDASDIKKSVLVRRSLDSRGKKNIFELRYLVYFKGEKEDGNSYSFPFRDVSNSEPIIIIGAGPAGLFAALKLIELGYKPIILERGKDVRSRRYDVANVSKKGIVNQDSNYCFGEGGAGTFSDGKLYTRSTKRGSIQGILDILVYSGADPDILIDAHPHIGTNKLPAVISSISNLIRECGGEILFNSRVVDVKLDGGKIAGVCLFGGEFLKSRAVILATGHSSRDVLEMLRKNSIFLEAKPYALGVRVEHPQALIDEMQYGMKVRHENLPAASYALKTQVLNRGVFSFCMCPGGIICPAATANDEVVVNGWSPSKRNSRYANSGIVVEISPEDLEEYKAHDVFAGVYLQQEIEKRAFNLGGGELRAPAQRLDDFVSGRFSTSLPDCSYNPGVKSVDLKEVFLEKIYLRLQQAFVDFNKKSKGYLTKEAIVVAVESRTSSPVRITRDNLTYMSLNTEGLFPCGEGAGYAGGIMSAAIDGQRVAEAVSRFCS